MKKRDLLTEIKEINGRHARKDRYDYTSKLDEVELIVVELQNYNGPVKENMMRYIPISTVACFQSFFRSVVKDMVDFGKPFSDRVAEFNQSKNVKLDFEVLAAIKEKSLTLGEFVSHILPYNNLNDVNGNLSVLMGGSFLDGLKSFDKTSIHKVLVELCQKFRSQSDAIIKSVNRTYELRHIFCHEFDANIQIDESEIIQNFTNCKLFLQQVNQFIYELLYPNAPETQTGMNLEASERFEIANQQLSDMIAVIKKAVLETLTPFPDNVTFDWWMESWFVYREKTAKYWASIAEGGSMYSQIYSTFMTRVTNDKIAEMRDQYSRILTSQTN